MKPFRNDVPERMFQSIIAPTLVALLIALLLGAISISRIDAAHTQARGASFVLETSEITLKIEERFKAYRQVLRGARALFAASQTVTRDEWRRYVTTLRLHVDYAGIQGVGFAQSIPAAELAEHERRVRAEGFPDYRVSPRGARDEYSSIVFLEPFDWRNQRAFGYDMFSEPVRHEAMARARSLGVPALTGKVRLVEETSTDVQFGVLLYLPVFRQGLPIDTTAQRERAFIGWVYSPFRLGDLITGTLGDAGQHLRIRVFDGHNLSADTLLFDSQPGRQPPPAQDPARAEQPDLDAGLRPFPWPRRQRSRPAAREAGGGADRQPLRDAHGRLLRLTPAHPRAGPHQRVLAGQRGALQLAGQPVP